MIPRVLSRAFAAIALFDLSFAPNVKVELKFTWGPTTTSGIERYAIFTNGQFPGPNLIWDEDDSIEVCSLNLVIQHGW